jgi:hypothetical protein
MARHYPTPSTTTYYINEYIIDDMYRVDFKRTQQHQPVWGYDSVKYDFIAKGKEITSGNIIVNFRYPGYLRNVLVKHEADSKRLLQRIVGKNILPGKTMDQIDAEHQDPAGLLAEIDNLANPSDQASLIAAQMTKEIEIKNISLNKLDLPVLKALKASLEERFYMASHGTSEEHIGTQSRYSSPLDSGEIIPFDMTCRYGFQGVPGGFVRIFRDIVLLGEQETVSASVNMGGDMSSSAQPILEVYPFVCRSIDIEEYI